MRQTKQSAEVRMHNVEKNLGKGWEGRVWENLGEWHVAWQNGAVCLHFSPYRNEYWAMVGNIGEGTGNVELTPRETTYHKEPRDAVKVAIEYAQEQDIKRRQIMLSCAGVLLSLGTE